MGGPVCMRVVPTADEVVATLAPYCASRPEVGFALLFGSVARGEARPTSDVDVAVRFRGAWPPGLAHPLFTLAADLPRRLRRSVDVVDLAAASPGLAFAVAAEGVMIWEITPGLVDLFRATAYGRYHDTAPLRRLHDTILLQELLQS